MKTQPHDLAILGGQPEFDRPLHVMRPNTADRAAFISRVEEMLDRGILTNQGPLVSELEERLCRYLGVKHCITTCNATTGLQLCFQALGLSGEVILPSMTFIATAHALLWMGITPVFCDMDPDTWNIDPDCCEALVSGRTTAIVPVHLWGRSCDTTRLRSIANRHGLRLVYDAAHAFGCGSGDSLIGGFGDAEVFSFHATKVFHTFEGGAITTNDDDLAARLRLSRNFGFTGYDQVAGLGINGKMSEVNAAMGISNLACIGETIARSRAHHELYREQLSSLPGITLLRYDREARHNHHYGIVEVDETALGLSRDQLLRALQAENIVARRYFHPGCHRMEPYRSRFPGSDTRLVHTNRATGRVMSLPAGASIRGEEIERVCAILRLAAAHADTVRTAIQREFA